MPLAELESLQNPRLTYNVPGDAHELTFSCNRKLPLLNADSTKQLFLDSLDLARRKWKFNVWAFVIMPEHVHLLIHPQLQKYSMSAIRRDIKRPMARAFSQELKNRDPKLHSKLINSKGTHSLWLPGAGYDRNLNSSEAIRASIDYLHANPVRRGLCRGDTDWWWSSARSYAGFTDVSFKVAICPMFL